MRIPDTARIKRLLESEGGSLGRREIIETLGLSDERYDDVAARLVGEGDALKNRGRAGGLRLPAAPAARREVRRLTAEELAERLENGDEDAIRGTIFELPDRSMRGEQPLFRHQVEALGLLEKNGGASGLIHLPTGAGKTRVGIEIAARRLRANPHERVIWVSYPLMLIRQGMARLVELAALFPRGTTFQWCEPYCRDEDLITRAHVTFMMRDDFMRLLARAGDPDVVEGTALVKALPKRGGCPRVTVLYDECHQLGATKLQSAWRKCERRAFADLSNWRDRFQTIGLSATPLPTNEDSHELLRTTVFPVGDATTVRPDWGMLVHASIDNARLVRDKILCPVNLSVQDAGTFDIPAELLLKAGSGRVREPGRPPQEDELLEFAETFNREVMSHDSVLQFLADRLAANLQTLGKTLVFAPTIAAANRLSQLLKNDRRVGPGRVSLVHSRLNELAERVESAPGDTDKMSFAEANRQIAAFTSRGHEPCVMVNVGMLTTGFDDPKIRTVLLGRLTFSTNLFWQMIGRGTRGLACGGTADCIVIDPVRLTARFSVLEGYRPTLDSENPYTPLEKVGAGALDPRVRPVRRAPTSPDAPPEISPTLRQDLIEALRAFLSTGKLDSAIVRDVVIHTASGKDGVLRSVFMPSSAPAPTGTLVDASGLPMFDLKIRMLEEELRNHAGHVDLSWLQEHQPSVMDDGDVRLFEEKLELVRRGRILTRDAFVRAQIEAHRRI